MQCSNKSVAENHRCPAGVFTWPTLEFHKLRRPVAALGCAETSQGNPAKTADSEDSQQHHDAEIHETFPAKGIRVKIPKPIYQQVERQPFPILFATISGAHLFGFPSADSDYDVRGIHVLPLHDVIGLKPGKHTIDHTQIIDQLEVDLVTHDVHMFFRLLLQKGGNMLEQIYSPLVVQTSAEHLELKHVAAQCITRNHVHHFLGFAQAQWNQTLKQPKPKSLLYAIRILLSGIHLMKTGRVESNISILNQETHRGYIDDLIKLKTSGKEKADLLNADLNFFEREYQRLRNVLQESAERSSLPDSPPGLEALNDLLLRIRMKGLHLP